MGREDRLRTIKEIEKVRKSRVLTYVTGDRHPIGAKIGDDALVPLYKQIRSLNRPKKLDLFLFTRGGAMDVPWRLVSALREACNEWNVLIPFRANSAGTLISLGADNIIFGNQGELGPIDPTMSIKKMVPGKDGVTTQVQDDISVEDVMAFVNFVKEKGELSEQHAMADALKVLTSRVDALCLGNVYRTYSHIRDVATQILESRKESTPPETIEKIVNTLAGEVYAHGHAIPLDKAREMGLPASRGSKKLEGLMWKLFTEYETDLKLRSPIDPQGILATGQKDYCEDVCLAVIETTAASYEFSSKVQIKGKRQLPQQLNVSLNLNLQMPPGIDINKLDPQAKNILQTLLQQAQQSALAEAQKAVQDALEAQAPLVGVDFRNLNGGWKEFRAEQ